MKALILNSGIGKRMGELTKQKCKCMAVLEKDTTILDRQLEKLYDAGIKDFCMTTGPFAKDLERYINEKYPMINIDFVHNPCYQHTNYIYSIFLAKEHLYDDILLLHGDLVFDSRVLDKLLYSKDSAMVVDSSVPLPEKDFKAVVENNRIKRIGIDEFKDSISAQPLYKIFLKDWLIWLNEIERFCDGGNTSVYAENAFNNVSNEMNLVPLDVQGYFCGEVDNMQDLTHIREIYHNIK